MIFPTAPTIIDDFNRGALGAAWTTPAFGASTSMSISANQLAGAGALSGAGTVATFGPDFEIFCTIPTLGSTAFYLFGNCTDNTFQVNCYALVVNSSSSIVQLEHILTGTHTKLGADITRTISAGDSVGLRGYGQANMIAEFWHRPVSTGAWQLVDYRYEARPAAITYAPGLFGVLTQDTTVRLDDLGGGLYGPEPIQNVDDFSSFPKTKLAYARSG